MEPRDSSRAGRLRRLVVPAVSSGVDVLVVGLMWVTGAVGWQAPVFLAGALILRSTTLLLLVLRGIPFPESAVQVLLAGLTAAAMIWWWPATTAYVFCVATFVHSVAVTHAGVKAMVISAGPLLVSATAALLAQPGALTIPNETIGQAIVMALGFATVMLRCVLLSARRARHHRRLVQVNIELSTSTRLLAEQVRVDGLTGALNHTSFWERLGDRTAAGAGFCVVMVDIDGFKEVNDRHGHLAGDEVLREVARLVQEELGDDDALGRLGGDEFAVLFEAPMAAAAQRWEHIRSRICAVDWSAIEDGLQVTVSGGVAEYRPGEGVIDLVRRADVALYGAKRAGRNTVVTSRTG